MSFSFVSLLYFERLPEIVRIAEKVLLERLNMLLCLILIGVSAYRRDDGAARIGRGAMFDLYGKDDHVSRLVG